ncbi:hypothetical protein SAMN05444161_3885 [Rhizobiales bacterium GAS191]|nr:hypothetical protein SAMN05444161_3885 [Rhizobiales bacterium GAS191]
MVLNIQVNTTEFQQFMALFKTYTDKLEASKKSWDDIAARMTKAQKASAGLTSTLGTLTSHAKSMGGHIKDATLNLFKWSTILGAVTGLVGLGGLYGLDRLANNIMSRRRQILGLGAEQTGGRLTAFEIYGRSLLGDPTGAVANVRGAQLDITQRRGLYSLGFRDKDIEGRRPEEMMPDIIERVMKRTASMPIGTIGPFMRATGISDVIPMEDISRFRALGPEGTKEWIDSLRKMIEAHKKELELSPKAQKGWIDLATSLSTTGTSIKNTFGELLGRLAPAIGELGEGIGKVIRTFLNLPFVDKVLNKFNYWLTELNNYMATNEFQERMKAWFNSFDGAMTKMGRWISNIDNLMTSIGAFADVVKIATAVIALRTAGSLFGGLFGGLGAAGRGAAGTIGLLGSRIPAVAGILGVAALADPSILDEAGMPNVGQEEQERLRKEYMKTHTAPGSTLRRLQRMFGGGPSITEQRTKDDIALGNQSIIAGSNTAIATGGSIAISGNTVQAMGGVSALIAWFSGQNVSTGRFTGFGDAAMGSFAAAGGRGGLRRHHTAGEVTGPLGLGEPGKAGSLTALITAEAQRAGVDPRILEGIRAGESRHRSSYDIKEDALESSWGPFQLNRRRGLGVEFEREMATELHGRTLKDPSTIPLQARWVANYVKKHGMYGVTKNWMGWHGLRNADPRWGESGYVPTDAVQRAAPAPTTMPPVPARSRNKDDDIRKQPGPLSSRNWEGSSKQAMLIVRNMPGSNFILHTTSLATGAA